MWDVTGEIVLLAREFDGEWGGCETLLQYYPQNTHKTLKKPTYQQVVTASIVCVDSDSLSLPVQSPLHYRVVVTSVRERWARLALLSVVVTLL
jgi:hypothetical protein